MNHSCHTSRILRFIGILAGWVAARAVNLARTTVIPAALRPLDQGAPPGPPSHIPLL
jgi:hypothetical protein